MWTIRTFSVTYTEFSCTLDLRDQTSFSFWRYLWSIPTSCNSQGCERFSDAEAIQIPLQVPPAVSLTGAVNGTTAIIMLTISQPTDLHDLQCTLRHWQTRQLHFNQCLLTCRIPCDKQETYEYKMSNSIGSIAQPVIQSVLPIHR